MFDNNTIVFNENKNIEDKRRYAYEKAIEAYWKHVDRYHTWMNYYAIFNGALFVGFCTLLTATASIKYDETSKLIILSNDNMILYIIICFLGIIASGSWLLSILGHEAWERNWMNIIKKYETTDIYNLIRIEESDVIRKKGKKYFKAFSTHKITLLFVCFIMVSWIITPLLLLFKVGSCSCIVMFFLYMGIILTSYILMLIYNLIEFTPLYSNCENKIIEII